LRDGLPIKAIASNAARQTAAPAFSAVTLMVVLVKPVRGDDKIFKPGKCSGLAHIAANIEGRVIRQECGIHRK